MQILISTYPGASMDLINASIFYRTRNRKKKPTINFVPFGFKIDDTHLNGSRYVSFYLKKKKKSRRKLPDKLNFPNEPHGPVWISWKEVIFQRQEVEVRNGMRMWKIEKMRIKNKESPKTANEKVKLKNDLFIWMFLHYKAKTDDWNDEEGNSRQIPGT